MGALGSSKAHKDIRSELIENHRLEAVISMPSGVFKPYAGVSTAVLIFTKDPAGTNDVWFYDMKADGFSLDDKRSQIDDNDIPDVIERFNNLENEKDRQRTEQSFFVPKQEIVDNEYDLSINKYKKIEYVTRRIRPHKLNHGRTARTGNGNHPRTFRLGGLTVMAKLGEICKINMGQSPDSSTYNNNKEGIPFFQGNADFGKINPTIRLWCSNPVKIAKENDILISVRAPIGALNISDCECCIGRGLASLTITTDKCIQKFLWYSLINRTHELISKGTGSTFKAINKQILFDLKIPLPPLEEQEKNSHGSG